MVVGWGSEPAYAGIVNSVQLTLSRGGEPLTDVAAGDIKVEVSFGDQKTTLDLEPAFVVGRFGTPGQYVAHLLPTRAGNYTFKFAGSHDGQKLDSTFTCGEQTFACIEETVAIQFPEKDPSLAELGDRIEREFPRVEQRVAAVRSDVGSSADTARLLGIIGIGLGAVALIVALVRGRGGKARA